MTALARALLAAAVHLLPSQSRSRYEDEFDAELLSLPRHRRLGFALSTLAAAPRLRWALLAVLCGGRASLRCWLGSTTTGTSTPTPTTTTSSPCSADAAVACATPSNTCRARSVSTMSPGAAPTSPAVADNSLRGLPPLRAICG